MCRNQVRLKHCAKAQNYEHEANKCSISQLFLLITTKAFGKYCIVNHFYFINQRTKYSISEFYLTNISHSDQKLISEDHLQNLYRQS